MAIHLTSQYHQKIFNKASTENQLNQYTENQITVSIAFPVLSSLKGANL